MSDEIKCICHDLWPIVLIALSAFASLVLGDVVNALFQLAAGAAILSVLIRCARAATAAELAQLAAQRVEASGR